MRPYLLTLFVLTIAVPHGSGQDKLTFLNGHVLEGKFVMYDTAYVQFSFTKRNKTRTEKFEAYRLYSYTKSNEPESVIYVQDSSIGNTWSATDAMYFVHGQQDAYEGFVPHLNHSMAFAFGLGISLFDTYQKRDVPTDRFFEGFFRGDPTLVHLVSPFVYFLAAGLPGITFDLSKVSNRSYLLEETYRMGYIRVVKNKRRFGGLKFSLIGSATGLGLYFLGRAIQ
jgi:hypothetical protein